MGQITQSNRDYHISRSLVHVHFPIIHSALDILELLSLLWFAYHFERRRRKNFIFRHHKRTAMDRLNEYEPTEMELKAVAAVLARSRMYRLEDCHIYAYF